MQLRSILGLAALALVTAGSVAFAGLGCGPGSETEFADTWGADAGGGDATSADAGSSYPGPSTEPIQKRGRYEVGYREIEVRYQATADGDDGNKQEKRELNVSIWYPTNEKDGFYPRYDGKLPRYEVVWKAELAPVDSMPMLIFSHGNGGIAEQNYFMTEYWASHGWVVVSPDHTGNTLNSGTAIDIGAAVYRPQDIRAVLDRMYSLESSDPLAGKISDKVVMSGHSFGGYTTLANSGAEYAVETLVGLCESGNLPQDYCDTFNTKKRRKLFREGFYDERIDVAIPQAPAGARIFQDGLEKLKVPTMLMTGGKDRTLPNDEEGDPIWDQMKGKEHRRLHFPEAGHFTFSNMCTIIGDDVERLNDDGCGKNNIEPKRAFEIINTYSLAFARYHLFGSDRAEEVVDGESQPVGQKGFEMSIGTD